MAIVLAGLLLGSSVSAQTPARLTWKTGQVLVYQVEHSTVATDVMEETKNETTSLLKLTRRWQVLSVDSAGVATLQMSLTALMQKRSAPDGKVFLYDSANPDKSSPQLKEVLSRFLNQPLAVLRVDGLGKVVEVKESKFGPASNYENELPFLGILPATGLKETQKWDRAYQITLAPPLGVGEKYDAVQNYECKSIKDGLATVALTTELKTTPKAPADAIPLWQMQPQGKIVYDLKAGRLHRATLRIDKELKGHQGEGSSSRFQSQYTIEYVEPK
jgi:hypothetical protein